MLFTTDRQTLDDLNIFGKHGGDSMFALFNHTVTRAGAALLEDMFRHPLSDERAINQRSRLLAYFADNKIEFPFSDTSFAAIESYLNNTDERTKLSAQEHSLGQKLSNLLGVDIDTASRYNGITELSELLKKLYHFLNQLDLGPDHPYQAKKNTMLLILSDAAFATLPSQPLGLALSKNDMAANDLIFRFRHRDLILKLLRHIAYMDVYCAVAQVAVGRRFIFPKAVNNEENLMLLEDVCHPQMEDAVSNSISLKWDSNVVFLTGANMAGKSTFMKSVSIALYLAHMGFPVAAKKMSFSPLDGIYTTINLPDNLGMGASHFYSEVLRVKKIAVELKTRRLFVLFDELFRGTNVKDACEATIAIIAAFAEKKNSIFVISTHIIEAAEVLQEKYSNINFIYLPTLMDGNKPVYTYKLHQGISSDRHGKIIIKNEGILDILQSGLENQNQSDQ